MILKRIQIWMICDENWQQCFMIKPNKIREIFFGCLFDNKFHITHTWYLYKHMYILQKEIPTHLYGALIYKINKRILYSQSRCLCIKFHLYERKKKKLRSIIGICHCIYLLVYCTFVYIYTKNIMHISIYEKHVELN
jgi:hypothetical protein